MLAYELPFIASILVPVILSGGKIKISELLLFQAAGSFFIKHISAAIAFFVALLCVQAKLTFVPFDMPEAETEIMAGAYIEYSGPGLALYRLARAMNFFILPVFLGTVFLGGFRFSGMHFIFSLGKLFIIAVLIILIKNTNPRLRIDQAVRFFWGPVTALATVAVLLAFIGR